MGEPRYEQSLTEITSLRVGYLLLLNGNMSQKELAIALGLTPGKLNHKIIGRTKWAVEDLLALSDFFGVSLDYLVGRTPLESVAPNKKTPAVATVEEGRTSD